MNTTAIKQRIVVLLADETFVQLLKFLVIGVFNTLFGYAVYALLVLVGMPEQPALAVAYIIGVTWNYFTHAKLVFGAKGYKRLPAYFAAYLLLYLLNAFFLEQLIAAGLQPLLAQAVIVPFAAAISFVLISRVLTGKWPMFGR
jgi:putative flippase GtrA